MKIKKLLTNLYRNNQYQNLSIKDLFKNIGKTVLAVFFDEIKLYSYEYKKYFPFVSGKKNKKVPFHFEEHFGNSLNNFLYNLLFTTSLPTILHYVDRMTMAHSIESRVPFLDHRLVEFSFTLKNEFKIDEGITKKILREAAKEVLPAMVFNRKDKKGFVTPGEQNWLRGPMKHLLEINNNDLGFLDKKIVQTVISDYRNGDNKNAKLVWRLATLNYWLKNFN